MHLEELIKMDKSLEVYVDCSDDEKYDFKLKDGKLMPLPQDIVNLYEAINNQESLELGWQCPGRRPPTPTETTSINQTNDESKDEEEVNKSDFDFQEDMSHPKLAVRPTGDNTPKGSAKKKTTTFNGILSNMARHRKLNMIPDNSGNS